MSPYVTEIVRCVQISFPRNGHQGVNGYIMRLAAADTAA